MKFKTICLAAVLFLLVMHTEGKNFYVTPQGGGSTGASWAEAWPGLRRIMWGRVNPGDTIFAAGGSYDRCFIADNGKSGQRVTLKRATGACHGTGIGWDPFFDSQVVVNGTMEFVGGQGNYFTIDGQVLDGIKILFGDNQSGIAVWTGITQVTMRYMDIQGPGRITFSGPTRCLDLTPLPERSSHILIEHCRIHGTETLVQLYDVDNIIIQYCELFNSGAINAATWHPNMLIMNYCDNGVFRNNICHHNEVEGFFVEGGSADNWQVYGNLFYENDRAIEMRAASSTNNFKVYNNTFANQRMATDGYGEEKNNIYYNIYAGGRSSGNYVFPSAKYTTTAQDPLFVNSKAGDYRLKPTALARNIGADLGSPFNLDMNGETRGADGRWDMGAYEYTQTNISLPNSNMLFAIDPALPHPLTNWKGVAGDYEMVNLMGQAVGYGNGLNSGVYFTNHRNGILIKTGKTVGIR